MHDTTHDPTTERKLRAARSALAVSGSSVLFLTVWNMLRSVLTFLYSSRFEDIRELMRSYQTDEIIITVCVMLIVLGIYGAVYFYIGLHAIAEGHKALDEHEAYYMTGKADAPEKTGQAAMDMTAGKSSMETAAESDHSEVLSEAVGAGKREMRREKKRQKKSRKREKRAEHRRNRYIVFAALVIVILTAEILWAFVAWFCKVGELVLIAEIPVELITLAAVTDLFVNAVKIRRYNRKHSRKDGGTACR